MRLAVVGRSGFVGAPVVEEAIARGHEVTLVTGDPVRILPRAGLRPVAGDLLSASHLYPLLRGHEVVLGGLDPDWRNPNLYDEYVRGARAILDATKRAGVPRLLWVGGAGSLEVAPGVQLVDTPDFPLRFKAGALAAREAFRLLQRERVLDWALLAPAIHLEEGPRTGIYRTGDDAPVYGANRDSHISVRDLAVAVLDEVERPRHHRRRFTVGY